MTSYHVTVWSQAKASDGSKCPGRTKQNIKVSIVKGSKALALMEAVAEATNIDIKRLVFTQVCELFLINVF